MSEENNGSDQNQTEGLVAALVGEGKKYATIEDLAKSRVEADNFIDTLKEENAVLRNKSQESATAKDIMDAIKSSQKDSQKPDATTLSDEDLQKKVIELLDQRNDEQTRESNRSQAKKLVSGKLDSSDDKAIDEFVKERAQSLGMSADDLWGLSEKTPEAFASLTGLTSNSRPNTGVPSNLPGQQNTSASRDAATMEIDGHKTKAWFDAQRKEMGNKKFISDGRLTAAQIKSREALGDRYYS